MTNMAEKWPRAPEETGGSAGVEELDKVGNHHQGAGLGRKALGIDDGGCK